MAQTIEIEFKNMLTKKEYQEFLEFFHVKKDLLKTHTNIYFDTLNFDLKKHHVSLRARLLRDTIELTIKHAKEKENIEITDIIHTHDLEVFQRTHHLSSIELNHYLMNLGITEPLYEIASLTTLRYEVNYKGALLVLDQSEYYGKTDYELELEAENYDEGLDLFHEILSQFSIPIRPSKHKISRAHEEKKNSQ